MPKLFPLLAALLFGTFMSCSGSSKSDKPVPAITKTETCTTDTGNSYEVYVPVHKASEKLPLLVIVDSHGAGKFALDKFKASAQTYHLILAASNTVKNGFAGFDQALQTLIDDVRKKYPAGKTLYLAGFSGGARMALGYATQHPADGLLLCGALASPEQLKALSCPVFSISGMDDFNFVETAQYLFQEQLAPANLKIELTHASHSWPEAHMLNNAIGFLAYSSNKDENAGPNARSDYSTYQQNRIDSLKKAGDYLRAALIARNMASVSSFDDRKDFAKALAELKSSQPYINQLNKLGSCLNAEMNLRQTYMDAFQNKDIGWWKKEIDGTNRAIATEKDSFDVDMFRRVKGFWGIACYSLCKQAVAQRQAKSLQKVLAIYRSVEPDNADMYYFSAFVPYWENDIQATQTALQTALKAGFTDVSQLEKDFPGIKH